jgi:hypothetical protein
MKSLIFCATAILSVSVGAFDATAAEIVWKGGARAVATTGCTGWNPLGQNWQAYYFFPLAGTSNGTNSTFTLIDGFSAESFQLNGQFTSVAKPVTGTHIYTRSGQYQATFRFDSISPAQTAITASTRFVSGRAIIGKWDNWNGSSTCVVAVDFSLVRSPE